jgi:hypothetical protein
MSAVASFAETRVTPLSDAEPWLIDTLRALAGLSNLQDNWDGYGSPPIRPDALESVRRLVSAVEMAELPTPAVVPVSGGGIGVVWKVGARELDLEFLPDGSVEFLIAFQQPATGDEVTQEGRLIIADQGRQLFDWLTRG